MSPSLAFYKPTDYTLNLDKLKIDMYGLDESYTKLHLLKNCKIIKSTKPYFGCFVFQYCFLLAYILLYQNESSPNKRFLKKKVF